MSRDRRNAMPLAARARGAAWLGAAVLLVTTVTACVDGRSAAPAPNGLPGTVPLGAVPEPISNQPPPPPPPTTPPPRVTVPDDLAPVTGPIVDVVPGNRLLMIGDSVLAVTAPRNGGNMCDSLAGFGWAVEIDAEPGRRVDFAQRVLDERLQPGDGTDWDAAAVLLGNFYDGDLGLYTDELRAVLDRLAPRPTIVYTLSEINDDAVAINEIISALPLSFPNVVVADWAGLTADDPDRLLVDGGPVPTIEGAGELVFLTAAVLGKFASTDGGECLQSVFVDDSAIVL